MNLLAPAPTIGSRFALAWLPPDGPLRRWFLVTLGIVVGQVIFYGPSLLGRKVLLPVDLLAQPNWYVPQDARTRNVVPHDVILSDVVLDIDINRRFIGKELRAGRLPIWCPQRYAGVPFFRTCFSPPYLLGYLVAAPWILPYVQLAIALVAGLGFYVFARQVLKAGFWPAALSAWCYPLTGVFMVWQGCGPPPVVCWLPWTLVAAEWSVSRPKGWGGPLLALFTAILMLSGQTDIAGQILLACGLFVVWRFFQRYAWRAFAWHSFAWLSVPALAWLLGILASTWLLLPLVEYTRHGARIVRRSQGEEERPPMGLMALPQVVFPEVWGLTLHGSTYLYPGNIPESAVGGYAGLLAGLLAAPLAWCRRKRRSQALLWLLFATLGLSWSANLPGIVQLLRLPGLNLMSHNRFVFLTSFSLLALATLGFDALWRRAVSPRWWFALPMLLLAGLGAWWAYRAVALPEPVASQLGVAVSQGAGSPALHDATDVLRVQRRFARSYAVAAGLAWAALAAWAWLSVRQRSHPRLALVVGSVLVAELLWFGYGLNPQCDPDLYYPSIPALEQIARDESGRIIGFNCLPANLGQTHGLPDVRGYDGVDPLRYVQLLLLGADPRTGVLPYALVQWLLPKLNVTPPDRLRLPPVLDLLGVRYLIFRGVPPAGIKPAYASPDYWVMKNPRALPRAFVPRRVEVIADDVHRLQKLGALDFDPRDVAYLESAVTLPNECRGEISISDEIPTRVWLRADMATPGLAVLTDAWDQGWRVYLDGEHAPLLRANHALRGVVVPTGSHALEFRYEPDSLRWGLRLSSCAALVGLGWAGGIWMRQRGKRREAA